MATSSKPGVLIVDDQPANRRLLARALSTLDVNIIEAQTSEEALVIARQEHELCVVLLDVHTPGMDGYTLASELRQKTNGATPPIIFISAVESDAAQHLRTHETGAVDFLSKPVSPRILLSKVRVFLELFLQRGQLEAANDALHKQTERLETTTKVSHQITSILDLDQLLLEFLSLIEDRFGHSYGGIWMQGDATRPDAIILRAGKYRTRQPVLEPGSTIPINATRSIIAHVFRTGKTYLSNDTRTDPVYLISEGLEGIRSELALPLRFGHSLLGVLDIQSEQTDAFSPGDITALSTLADQVAVALRNVRLYNEVRRLNEDLEAQVTQRTAELEQAYQQLELLDRNKSDFITVVSHELRTPLTLINGFSQMLSDDEVVVSDALRKQLVDGIVAGARRMRGIVDSMLDVVKIDSRTLRLDRTSVNLHELLTTLSVRLAPVIQQRRHKLTIEALAELPQIEADSVELTKVFDELLTNAIKYTPDGGQVTVHGWCLTPSPDAKDTYVEVVVQDTGIGIGPDHLELIFTKFYRTGDISLHSSGRTKFKAGGPGLGLTIARGIVEAHGGHIWVESPGHDERKLPGSKFHVILPVKQPVL